MRSASPTHLLLLASFVIAGGQFTVTIANDDIANSIAKRMTREAQAASAAGDLELRDQLLTRAVSIAPDHTGARWARGEMQVDGEWQSVSAIQAQASNSQQIEHYEQQRQAIFEDTANHLQVAKWCQRRGLIDEARYHWLQVMSIDPNHREALEALGQEWVNGQLLSKSEAEQQRAEARQQRKKSREWKVRIAGWERALAAGGDEAARALADLEAEVDESAITTFENLVSNRRGSSQAEFNRNVQLCNQFLMAMGRLPSYKATVALARFAVLADELTLRETATEQLMERPQYEALPLLIAGLSPIIETRFELNRSETGRISYTHEFFAEGPGADIVAENSTSATTPVVTSADDSQDDRRRAVRTAERRSYGQWQRLARDAAKIERQVASANASREEMNGRIVAVLQALTDQSFGNDPTEWWDYWREHNGYDSYRPTVTYRTSLTYVEPVPVLPPSCECFAAGTLVWTKTGLEPIETLSAGDLVLTMDVATGERCFRPVLDTTIRAPSPLMHIATGNYQLLATPGHPFWVEGQGWLMAKELSAGDYIATAEGVPMEVRVTTTSDVEQEAFNLIVEGNNNYFVGQEGLLSHDNTPRRPDRARDGDW